MVLRLVIFALRRTLGVLLGTVVTLLFGRGRMSARVLRSVNLMRRFGRF